MVKCGKKQNYFDVLGNDGILQLYHLKYLFLLHQQYKSQLEHLGIQQLRGFKEFTKLWADRDDKTYNHYTIISLCNIN